jgi:hypothetical protein
LSTFDGVRAVTSLSDDFEVWLRVEDEPQALTDNGVIVGQQDAGLELGYERLPRLRRLRRLVGRRPALRYVKAPMARWRRGMQAGAATKGERHVAQHRLRP